MTESDLLFYKYNIITLCTLFNTKKEHGDIYINCKEFIKLINNYYIYSTPPLNVLDFPRVYFPFTQESQTPVLFTNTTLFNLSDKFIDPENKTLTDLRLTSLVITLIHLRLRKDSKENTLSLLSQTREGKEFVSGLYSHLCNKSNTFINDYLKLICHISIVDLNYLRDYLLYVFKLHTSFSSILSEYETTFGVPYDFFR